MNLVLTCDRPAGYVALLLWVCAAVPAGAQFLSPEHEHQTPSANGMPPPPAAAGAPPAGRSPGSDPMMLLSNSPSVQAALGLAPHQIQRLVQTERLFRAQHQASAATAVASSRADLERQVRASGGALDQILSREQLHRLQQIMLQLEGPCLAIHDRQFVQGVGLSLAQQLEIAGICRQLALNTQRTFLPATPEADACSEALAMRTRAERMKLQATVSIESLLTPQQRENLIQMQGPAVEIEPMLPPPCHKSALPY